MQYEVHFLIEKTIIVDACDDIQAELEAAKKLSREERYTVRGCQYTDCGFDGQIPIKEFGEVDFEWWSEHDIVDMRSYDSNHGGLK